MAEGFALLAHKVSQLQSEFSGKAEAKRLTRLGVKLKGEVDHAVRSTPAGHGSLSDGSMSGWRRGKPIVIKGRYELLSDHELAIDPNAKGPMRVLESGRNQGNAGGFSGRGVNRKTGQTALTKKGSLRKVRSVRKKRWNGTTSGKGTWSRASTAVVAKAPAEIARAIEQSMAAIFTKG